MGIILARVGLFVAITSKRREGIMASDTRSFAIVTGASSGIGYELAKQCAEHGYDLLIAADEAKIDDATDSLRALGASVDVIEADLATLEGVDALHAATGGRVVDALLA